MNFLLPSLGADMDSGILLAWSVSPGDEVERGQVIAEVETDKGIIEVECWHDCVVEELLIAPGPDPLPVGTPLARLRVEQEPAVSAPPVAGKGPATRRAGDTRSPLQRRRAAPRARRIAESLGVDLGTMTATGDGGVITTSDVRAAAGAGAEVTGAVARMMTRSKRDIPHYYLGSRIDLSAASRWLAALNEDRPVARTLLLPVVLTRAVALAATRVEGINGRFTDGVFRPSNRVHLAVGRITPQRRRGGAGAARRRDDGPRHDGRGTAPVRHVGKGREDAKLVDGRCDAHPHESRGTRSRNRVSGHRPAPGGHRRIRLRDRPGGLDRRAGRTIRVPPLHPRDIGRRSQGERRPHRRTLSPYDRCPAREPGGSVKEHEARSIIFAALHDVAPEVDPASVSETEDLTEQLDLDSMDYLNWLIGISETAAVEIPHWDLERLLRIDSAVTYLVERSAEPDSASD